jgi:hypothetical protein
MNLSKILALSFITLSIQAIDVKVLSFTTENQEYDSASISRVYADAENNVEMIELRDGNIIYDTEITTATLIGIINGKDKSKVLNQAGIFLRGKKGEGNSDVLIDWIRKPDFDSNRLPTDINIGNIFDRVGGDTSGGG